MNNCIKWGTPEPLGEQYVCAKCQDKQSAPSNIELDKAIEGATLFLFDHPHPRVMVGKHEFDLEQLLLAAKRFKEVEKELNLLADTHQHADKRIVELSMELSALRTKLVIAETTCDELRPLIEKNLQLHTDYKKALEALKEVHDTENCPLCACGEDGAFATDCLIHNILSTPSAIAEMKGANE